MCHASLLSQRGGVSWKPDGCDEVEQAARALSAGWLMAQLMRWRPRRGELANWGGGGGGRIVAVNTRAGTGGKMVLLKNVVVVGSYF